MDIAIRNGIALLFTSGRIQRTFESADDPRSIKIAEAMEKRTGFPKLEIHRFHTAVLRRNVEHSFSEKRRGELAWALGKEMVRDEGKLPPKNAAKGICKFSAAKNIPIKLVSAVIRELFVEVIEEDLGIR